MLTQLKKRLIHAYKNTAIKILSSATFTNNRNTDAIFTKDDHHLLDVINFLPNPFVILDDQCKILITNEAFDRFFNFDHFNVHDKYDFEIIRSKEFHNFIVENSASLRSERILNLKLDKEYFFKATVTPYQSHYYLVHMQDITFLKEFEQSKINFVSTVSHEFNTPLTSIIMGASILEDRDFGALSDKQMEVVKAIAEDGERLSRFISELIELCKIESEKAIYSFEPCSMSAIVGQSIEQYRGLAQEENVKIENDVDDSSPPVYADVKRISWVINHLLSNALKYTKSGDKITIRTKPEGDYMETIVQDTGDRILPECLERIFDDFIQIKGEDIEARGTGIGLAAAKEIVTAHKGKISVESKTELGNIFRFTLPLVPCCGI